MEKIEKYTEITKLKIYEYATILKLNNIDIGMETLSPNIFELKMLRDSLKKDIDNKVSMKENNYLGGLPYYIDNYEKNKKNNNFLVANQMNRIIRSVYEAGLKNVSKGLH